MPAGLLYDTPENVLALLKYMKSKNYSVNELEMGEEPEGQLISPIDYAALYCQWGKMIRNAFPEIRMGGPGFATIAYTNDDDSTFTEAQWTRAFLDYLQGHDCASLFNFFSFEWYPFDDVCVPSSSQLLAAPEMLSIGLKNFKSILSENIPIYLAEYGYSAYEGRAEVEINGALMYADILGKFLELGGSKNFLYGYEPALLDHLPGCDFGNNMLFGLGKKGGIQYKTAAFYAMQMITHFWAQPADSILEIYPAKSDIINKKNQEMVSAYAIRTSRGKWSIMLINKNPRKEITVKLEVENTLTGKSNPFQASEFIQYSSQQYKWVNAGISSHPSVALPPVRKKINGAKNISLPPYSLTILN